MNIESINPIFSTAAMTEIFSLKSQLRAMMRFEWALACALEESGLAATGSGEALRRHHGAEFVDQCALIEAAPRSGNIAIPFIRQLTNAIKTENQSAALTIHLGATSQDLLDTALALQMREAVEMLYDALSQLESALEKQVRVHARTMMAGRTWLQPGPPVTLGLKLAGVLVALRRSHKRIKTASEHAIVLQFGGAVGTLAPLGECGGSVSSELSRHLALKEAKIPWHTHRDNLVDLAASLSILTGTLGKFARDVSLLMQAEIGEISEPHLEGRGGSSTMPHKRNPVACATVLACATRVPGLLATLLAAMIQEHERGLGTWQAEWEALPEIFKLTACALDRAIEIAEGLEVNADRMAGNLDALLGVNQAEAVSTALAPKLGRDVAHELLREASRTAAAQHQHLSQILKAMPEVNRQLDEEEIERLLRPDEYLGSTQRFIHRVLEGDDADC